MQAPVPVALTQAQVAAVVTVEAAVRVGDTPVEVAVRVEDTPVVEEAVPVVADSPVVDVPAAEVPALADKPFYG